MSDRSDRCVFCEKRGGEEQGALISRGCCDPDWVCDACLASKSLAEYVAKAVL